MFPTQRMPELRAFAMMVSGTFPHPLLVELGSDTGESARFFSEQKIDVISVDLKNTGYPDEINEPYPLFIRGNSHDEKVAAGILEWHDIPHAVFVDASHEYEDVSKDFEVWWPRTKYIMGFHDICLPGVGKFWSEIKRKIPSVEIFARDDESEREWNQIAPNQPSGIGVLFKE